MRDYRGTLTVLVALVAVGGCIHKRSRVEVRSLSGAQEPSAVTTPVRAHLTDGSVVVFSQGVGLSGDTLRGPGIRYGLDLVATDSVGTLSLEEVVGLETFSGSEETMAALTAVTSTVGVAVGVAGTVALLKALFGSCPTFYSRAGGADLDLLEAEGFSYSIAPLLESRDVDVLAARPDADGWVALELRNEALETHYLNHVELLEVVHGPEERVLPDEQGRPLVVASEVPPLEARDRADRDVTVALGREGDDTVYATAPSVVQSASAEDLTDHVDLLFPRPAGADSVGVTFRMRNSLLNTLLFYDFMLGRGGLRAVEMLGVELARIGSVVELGRWYRTHLGMRVSVHDGTSYRQVARIGDSGPIAWKDVGVIVPVPPGDGPLRVRISSLADEWRIDRVALATYVRRDPGRPVPLGLVVDRHGETDPGARERMARPDEDYHVTGPGYHGTLRFRSPSSPAPGVERAFLLASQGYYTEWIRPGWIRDTSRSAPFSTDAATLEQLLAEWREVREGLEERFYATRIPVR